MRARELYENANELLGYRCGGLNGRKEKLYARDIDRAQCGRARTDRACRIDRVLLDVNMTGDRGLGSDERHCQQSIEHQLSDFSDSAHLASRHSYAGKDSPREQICQFTLRVNILELVPHLNRAPIIRQDRIAVPCSPCRQQDLVIDCFH